MPEVVDQERQRQLHELNERVAFVTWIMLELEIEQPNVTADGNYVDSRIQLAWRSWFVRSLTFEAR
jgi:hypothetical protein